MFPLLFINIVPTIATEEENIDSFDVHPANRWVETSTGFDSEVSNGLLNFTDAADGSTDVGTITRGLRDLDGKIEVRFLLNISADGDSFANEFRVILSGTPDRSDNFVFFRVANLKSEDFSATETLFGFDIDSGERKISLSGDERVHDNTWYVLKIDYNILKSTVRTRLSFDNGSKVFDYDYSDLQALYGDTFRLDFFRSTEMTLQIYSSSRTNLTTSTYLIDYIKAPFKEREWTQSDTPGDADWLQDAYSLAYVQDDIDDTSGWILDVPSLDVVSGSLIMDWSDRETGNFVDEDTASMKFELYGIDADDGDIHLLVNVGIAMEYDTPNTQMVVFFTISDHIGVIFIETWIDVTPWVLHPRLDYVFTLAEDRSRVDVRVRVLPDAEGTDFKDFVAAIDVADSTTDPSQEFLLLFSYLADFTGDVELTMLIEDFGFTGADIFADIIKGIVDPIGNFLSSIFTIAFKFLAGIFRIVGDLITAAISFATTIIETAIGLVITAVEAVTTELGNILTELGLLAAAIATEVWDGIGDALDFITEAITDLATQIWTEVSAFVDDILDELLTALAIVAEEAATVVFDVLEFLIVLVLDIIDGVINFVIEATFFIWDLLGLPDLILIYDTVIVGLIQVATSTPDMFIWLLDVWFFWATGIFFLGFLLLLGFPVVSSKTPGQLINNFRDMNSMDATLGLSILGFQIAIPIGFVFWPTFFLMFLVPLL